MKISNILLEYSRQRTSANHGKRLLSASKRDSVFYIDHKKIIDQESEETAVDIILNTLELIDPTANKQYMIWIVNRYIRLEFRIEDSQSVRSALQEFINLRTQLKRMGKTTDINQYSWIELRELIDSVTNVSVDVDTALPESEEVKYLYRGPYGVLAVPLTEQASCELGRGTRWCTAAQTNNMFDHYNSKGSLYIWIDKSGDKYQFHFESSQFMDSRDVEIPVDKLRYFRNRHPILSKFFAAKENKMLSDLKSGLIEINKLVLYAVYVLKGRWRELEPILFHSTDSFAKLEYFGIMTPEDTDVMKYADTPELIVHYAVRVVGGRWREKEHVILDSGDVTAMIDYVRYLKVIIPEFESAILRLANLVELLEYGKVYAAVMKKPWMAGKKRLEEFPDKSVDGIYPHVMKRFWEQVLNFDRTLREDHDRWPEYEEYMVENDLGHDAIYYSRYIDDLLPNLEPIIFSTNLTGAILTYYRKRYQGSNTRLFALEKEIIKQNTQGNLRQSDRALNYLTILNSVRYQEHYAVERAEIIGDPIRIPELERLIFKSAYDSYMYAKYVLKQRIPEAEPSIIRDYETTKKYARFFGISPDDLKTA